MTTRPLRAIGMMVLCGASLCGWAQGITGGIGVFEPPSGKKAAPRGSIAGHVYLADTRTPARSARIMAIPMASLAPQKSGIGAVSGAPAMAVTMLDGGFLIQHVAVGEYAVIAMVAGYLSPLDGVISFDNDNSPESRAAVEKLLRQSGSIVSVTERDSARVDIELQRGAVLSGKVVYADGSPATQLAIAPEKIEEAKSASAANAVDAGAMIRAMFLQQRTGTDDQGHFRIAGISPGSYRLYVKQTFDSATDIGQMITALYNPGVRQKNALTVYSGNTLHRKEARVYDLKAGDAVDGIEVVLPLTGFHAVHGFAAAKDGTPLNSGAVDLTDAADSGITFQAMIQSDGSFRFGGVPEGSYTLKASQVTIFANPPDANFPLENLKYMQQQFKPQRAFGEASVGVVVQTTDIENLTVALPETKLPDSPKMLGIQGQLMPENQE